jgi:hypothetical protein
MKKVQTRVPCIRLRGLGAGGLWDGEEGRKEKSSEGAIKAALGAALSQDYLRSTQGPTELCLEIEAVEAPTPRPGRTLVQSQTLQPKAALSPR